MATVGVKNVDEKLYRKVRALAALRGKTMGAVLNEALAVWLSISSGEENGERWMALAEGSRTDNHVYRQEERTMLENHRGEYVAIARGSILGFFKGANEACDTVKASGAKSGIVTKVEEKRPRVVELGWSALEQPA